MQCIDFATDNGGEKVKIKVETFKDVSKLEQFINDNGITKTNIQYIERVSYELWILLYWEK